MTPPTELGPCTDLGVACLPTHPSPRPPQLLKKKALEKAAPSDASSRVADAEAGKPLLNGSTADSKPAGSKE